MQNEQSDVCASRHGIDAVFSMEPLSFPDAGCEVGIIGLNCAGFGSTMVVTASFGMHAAALVLRKLAGM